MTTLTPVNDVTGYLTSPSVPGAGNEIWMLRMQSGIIIGGVDAVISAITGFSPLEEWVFKPLGGDWDALDRGAVAWKQAGKAAGALGENIRSLPGQVGDAWTGGGAQSFCEAQVKVCAAIKPLPAACESLSTFCRTIAELARSIASFVAGLLKDLSHWALKMIASAVVPIAGEVAMAGWLVELGAKIAKWVPKLTRMITQFINFVAKVVPIVEKIRKVVLKIDTLLSKLAGLAKIANAGSRAAGMVLT